MDIDFRDVDAELRAALVKLDGTILNLRNLQSSVGLSPYLYRRASSIVEEARTLNSRVEEFALCAERARRIYAEEAEAQRQSPC